MNTALDTIKWFMGIHDSRVTTLDGLRKRTNKVVSSYESSGWTFDKLIEMANDALDALDSCVHVKPGVVKRWGVEATDHREWSGMRLIGAFISHGDTISTCDYCELFGQLPYHAIWGLDRAAICGADSDSSHFAFVIVQRLDSLPAAYSPSGPGYPYMVDFVSLFKRKKENEPIRIQWFCTIDNAGKVYAPYYTQPFTQVIRKRSQKQMYHVSIPRAVRRLYDPIAEMAKDEKKEEYLTGPEVVAYAINAQSRVDLNVTARISDHRGVINVSISMEDAKHLFKKRVKVKTKTGRSKPIIHWVRSHRRITGSNVKTHWKGLRSFEWKGLDVEIYIPGLHRPLINRMPAVIESNAGWITKLLSKSTTVENPYNHEKFEVTYVTEGEFKKSSIYYTNTTVH